MGNDEMNVPEELLERLDTLEELRREQDELEARRLQAQQAKAERIERLRREKAEELKLASEAVFEWARRLVTTDVYRRIAKLKGNGARVPIFIGHFWRGEPDRKSVATWASLSVVVRSCDPCGCIQLEYREYHKGHGRDRLEILRPERLVALTHPEFVLDAAGYLNGPEPFGRIVEWLRH